MGCTYSVYGLGRKKKLSIPEVVVYVPSMRIPAQCDLQRALKGLIPRDLIDRLSCLRNRIALIAEDTGGSAITELRQALEEYLSILIGLTKKEHGLEDLVEFKWKNLEDGRQETCVANAWFELLSVVHMMAMLTLSEADTLMIPKDYSGSGFRVVSTDCKRDAVDLLLKSAGYLEFGVRNVLSRIPAEIKKSLSKDLQDGVLEAIAIQALAQGTEIQLGLAVESQKATLSVKRRLACEQLIYYSQAYQCLSGCDLGHGYGKKHTWFIKWKFLESKAAAYYYHGLVLDKSNEPTCHISAVCCFLAAQELLVESKKACISFCLSAPVTRLVLILGYENRQLLWYCLWSIFSNLILFLFWWKRAPPLWGVMKHLHQKIPEVASRKSQMYGYLLEQEKALQSLPDLPDFQLSLRPDDYELPGIDPAWDCEKWENQSQSLKEHLKDCEDEMEKE
ncbi:PREDICTED: BRO1 domain-containing protein BROX homolog isoform X2 [Theobroma cacao]|uniref:BRO1 domain-containing protein BROX homolog isoform X2 n=1 Tax=Theobroma cacao TaxID=3641 RepID=A0AB32WB36_THECC|nr:PREDICTED: BRO1 domain-containing protein BROX homolog isoform X2 [Theobroma cacao]